MEYGWVWWWMYLGLRLPLVLLPVLGVYDEQRRVGLLDGVSVEQQSPAYDHEHEHERQDDLQERVQGPGVCHGVHHGAHGVHVSGVWCAVYSTGPGLVLVRDWSAAMAMCTRGTLAEY